MSLIYQKVGVIGTGYVGLVTGVCFASKGIDVICMDNMQSKVDKLNSGICTIYEPDLEEYMDKAITNRKLQFTTDLEYVIDSSDIVFLCLPTPPKEDGSADLSYVEAVAKSICSVVKSDKIIVNKSTVPVGTCDIVKNIFAQYNTNKNVEIQVISNPEFLREGFAVGDFLNPDRIVVGVESGPKELEVKNAMTNLYQDFIQNSDQLIFMDIKSSEMTKYAGNSFLAVKITFINEMANLCEKVGANIDFVRKGIGADSRIGSKFLYPGIGYGGSCFPKDVQALNNTSDQNNYKFEILKTVMSVNEKQKYIFVDKITDRFGDLSGKVFGVWGLAFKANTDDIRESPAIAIVKLLLAKGCIVKCYDPKAMSNVTKLHPDINLVENKYAAIQDVDALLILTEWQEFANYDLDLLVQTLSQPLIFDGRNLFDPQEMKKLGFEYISVGR